MNFGHSQFPPCNGTITKFACWTVQFQHNNSHGERLWILRARLTRLFCSISTS